jgi:hypothetical protein
MGSSMGRETDGAGNHVSDCPAQNASNTGKKEPRPTLPLKTADVPFFLAHVSSVDDDNKGSNSFCKYLPICINNYTCSSLVDFGTVWRNAISKDFAFNQMKLTEADLRCLSTKTIGTAKDGASMRVLGEVT